METLLLALVGATVAYLYGRSQANDSKEALREQAKADADYRKTQEEQEEKDNQRITEEIRKEEERRGSTVTNIPKETTQDNYAEQYKKWKEAQQKGSNSSTAQPGLQDMVRRNMK